MSPIHSRLGRRNFAKALGVGVGLGTFGGLLGPLVRSLSAQDEPPRRVVLVVTGNGIEGHNLLSPIAREMRGSHSGATPLEVSGDLAQAPALASLRGDGTELDLTSRAVALHGLSSKITGGSHTTHYKALCSSNRRRQTIDSWLEDRLQVAGQPFSAVRLGNLGGSGGLQYNICLKSATQQLPIITSPRDAYDLIFGSLSGSAEFEERGALLDFAIEDLRWADSNFRGAASERQKLESYLASLEEMHRVREDILRLGPHLERVRGEHGLSAEEADTWNADSAMPRLQHQFRLATAAITGALTNVVVITNHVGDAFNGGLYYDSLRDLVMEEEFDSRHTMCHEAAGNPRYQAVLDRVIEIQVEEIAKLARRLAATPEGDGTMLDHTLIVFMSDNGDTHHSQAGNWPMLLVGGESLGVRTGGRAVIYPSSPDERYRVSNLFNTLGYAAGHELDDFGGEPDPHRVELGGPLAELMS